MVMITRGVSPRALTRAAKNAKNAQANVAFFSGVARAGVTASKAVPRVQAQPIAFAKGKWEGSLYSSNK